MKVHYPKLYNMAHLSLNVFTASKGSNNYILFKIVVVKCFNGCKNTIFRLKIVFQVRLK